MSALPKHRCRIVRGLVVVLCVVLAAPVRAELVASVLPSSRSATVGTPVTVFATVINSVVLASSDSDALYKQLADESVEDAGWARRCQVGVVGELPLDFSYQLTDTQTNAPIGEPNVPVDIAPNARASFVLMLRPYAEISPQDVRFDFSCENLPAAKSLRGVNTLLLSANINAKPDVIALSMSASGSGSVVLTDVLQGVINCTPEPAADDLAGCQVGVFALAAVNVGEGSDVLFLRAATRTGVQLQVCATHSATGECDTAVQPDGIGVALDSGEVGTYSVFITSTNRLSFDPASARVNVEFVDEQGEVRGATSVAISSQRKDWFAWRDTVDGVNTLRLTGEVQASTPCHHAVASVAPQQDPTSNYLAVDVELISSLTQGSSCVQVLSNIPLSFELEDYVENHAGLVISTPLGATEVVEIRESI